MKIKALKPQGISLTENNIEVILKMTSMLKENVVFSEEETIGYLESLNTFQSAISNSPHHKILSLTELSNSIRSDDSTFSKYVSKEVYDKYISKGQFQFGTIKYYQEIENSKIRDEYEGYSNIQLAINNHQTFYSCITGFNYLIFCGTKKSDSTEHKGQFGDVQMRIPNIHSFARATQRALNAQSFTIGAVQYSNAKYFRGPDLNLDPFDPNNLMSKEIIDYLKKEAFLPSLFVKPEAFKHEEEIRIVFEMSKDQRKPLKISNLGLLDCIEIK